MNNTFELDNLPLIVFSATVAGDSLRIENAAGGLLAALGASPPYPEWIDAAIHPQARAAFISPSTDTARQPVRLRAADGSWRWIGLRIGRIDGSGEQLRYDGLLIDACLYKTLEGTAQRYRDFTELSSDWYWEMDAQHRFTYFSREFEEISGISRNSALGKTRWEGLGRERLGNVDWEGHIRLLDEHKPFRNFEYPSRRGDGRLVWFRVSGRPRHDDNGNFVGYYGIASDISANRRIEQRLHQSEHLASIGRLAAGVAHEINNPIGFVRSNLESLNGYLHDLLDLLEHYTAIEPQYASAEMRDTLRNRRLAADLEYIREDAPALLGECRQGLDRVRKIVADLREFSREGDAQWGETELSARVDSAINLLAGDLLKDVEIVRRYAELPPLYCCPTQINQVFLALLGNAAQAIGEKAKTAKTAEKGVAESITITTGQDDSGQQWAEIADTGCGIAPEHLPHLFEPFFTTRQVGKGTGMGLAMCFGIVAEHGGKIEASSTPGSGATFRVALPPRRPDAVTSPG